MQSNVQISTEKITKKKNDYSFKDFNKAEII